MTQTIGWWSKDPANEGMAKNALEILCKHYPGHAWFVRIDGGCLMVYDFEIDQRHCMVQHYSKISSDQTTFEKSIARAAGELLERARLKRGEKRHGEQAIEVDGIANHKRRAPGLIQVVTKHTL